MAHRTTSAIARAFAAGLVVLSPVAAQEAPPPPEAVRALAEAAQRWQARRPAEAIAALDRAIALDPRYVEARVRRGFVLSQLGRNDEALAAFAEAERIAPARADVPLARARHFMHAGEPIRAIPDLETVIDRAPWWPEPYVEAARAYVAVDELGRALDAFDRALLAHPQNPTGFVERGMVLLRMGRVQEAAEDIAYAERLRPGLRERFRAPIEDAAGHRGADPRPPPLAGATIADAARLILDGRDRDAIHVLDLALSGAPGDADGHLLRAMARSDLKQFALARIEADQAIRLRPGDARAHHARARIHLALFDADAALADLDRALQLDPAFAMAYVDRGVLLLRHRPDRPGDAERDFQAAVAVDPDNPYAWYGRALVQGFDPADPRMQWDREIADLERAIRINPGFARAHAKRGIARLGKASAMPDGPARERLWLDAAADLRRAIELEPTLRPAVARDIDGLKHLPAIRARGQWMWAIVTDPAPPRMPAAGGDRCAGLRGGAAGACDARDWMAQQRYQGGTATADDRRRFGSY
ncbi:MAG: tetratricopeptide repeat protein [Alphaproteobacteria bacterium]